MASTNNQITHNFPNPVLTTLGDNTTDSSFATLQIVQKELNANAVYVYTLRGDVIIGHLILTIPAADYTAHCVGNAALTIPPCPPELVEHIQPATPHTISKDNRLHAKAQQ
jgi:hypothetical protein